MRRTAFRSTLPRAARRGPVLPTGADCPERRARCQGYSQAARRSETTWVTAPLPDERGGDGRRGGDRGGCLVSQVIEYRLRGRKLRGDGLERGGVYRSAPAARLDNESDRGTVVGKRGEE